MGAGAGAGAGAGGVGVGVSRLDMWAPGGTADADALAEMQAIEEELATQEWQGYLEEHSGGMYGW